ncbi:MAG: hypothetical protein J6A83_07505 [Clostridia bacterium]|nr:hypothetical protein [Clostridia bacterium]
MKICALAVICVVVGALIKEIRKEISFAIRAAACIMIFGILIISAEGLIERVSNAWIVGDWKYAEVMIRALGIAFLTHITAGICRDCGEGSIAAGVELAGKLEILFLCLPLIGEILGYASRLMS